MPIFKVKIAIKTTYYSSIVVDAENVNSALEYARNNDEWQEEDMDDENCYCCEKTPCSAHEIHYIEELPRNYKLSSRPWNGDGKKDINEIIGR